MVTVNDVDRERVRFHTRSTGAVWMRSEVLVETYVRAARRDDGRAMQGGVTFERDTLGAVVSRLVDEFPCHNLEHWRSGADYPGLHDMGGGTFFCRNCCAANDDSAMAG